MNSFPVGGRTQENYRGRDVQSWGPGKDIAGMKFGRGSGRKEAKSRTTNSGTGCRNFNSRSWNFGKVIIQGGKGKCRGGVGGRLPSGGRTVMGN